jgi:hypothetical protein
MDPALHRLSRGPRGGGWGAAGEGRRRGGEGECESQLGTCARTAPGRCLSFSHARFYLSGVLLLSSPRISHERVVAARLFGIVRRPGPLREW